MILIVTLQTEGAELGIVAYYRGGFIAVTFTQLCLQITPYVPLPRKRSPDGATTDC